MRDLLYHLFYPYIIGALICALSCFYELKAYNNTRKKKQSREAIVWLMASIIFLLWGSYNSLDLILKDYKTTVGTLVKFEREYKDPFSYQLFIKGINGVEDYTISTGKTKVLSLEEGQQYSVKYSRRMAVVTEIFKVDKD